MEKNNGFLQKAGAGLSSFWDKTQPFRNGVVKVCKWAYKLRNILLTVPVAALAVIFAVVNMAQLPDAVMISWPMIRDGILVIQDILVSKLLAVFAPLAVTAFCLLMVIASKRMVYPWLISLFSLALPLFFYFCTVFPA